MKCIGSVKPSQGMRRPPASPPPGYPKETAATLLMLQANDADTMSMKKGASVCASAPVRTEVSSVGTAVFVGCTQPPVCMVSNFVLRSS